MKIGKLAIPSWPDLACSLLYFGFAVFAVLVFPLVFAGRAHAALKDVDGSNVVSSTTLGAVDTETGTVGDLLSLASVPSLQAVTESGGTTTGKIKAKGGLVVGPYSGSDESDAIDNAIAVGQGVVVTRGNSFAVGRNIRLDYPHSFLFNATETIRSATRQGRAAFYPEGGVDGFIVDGKTFRQQVAETPSVASAIAAVEASTAMVERVAADFAATGAVFRASSVGNAERWVDATGCVWRVESVENYVYSPWRWSGTDAILCIEWGVATLELGYGWRIFVDGDATEVLSHDANATELSADTTPVPSAFGLGYSWRAWRDLLSTHEMVTNFVGRVALTNDVPASTAPSAPVVSSELSWRPDGTGCVVTVPAAGTLSADLTGWTECQSVTAIITLESGATVSPSIVLVGYGEWPVGEAFVAACVRVGQKIYVSPITVVQ